MSAVYLLTQLDSGILYDLNGFKSRINFRFFLSRFPVCFNLFMLLFLVAPCLVMAVQPCRE